jgi:hypothetical protein
MKISKYILLVILAAYLVTACKKDDHLANTGLGVTDVEGIGKRTSYEFLASNKVFDTLVMLINKAGMKDEINGNNITFFPPTNIGINNFLSIRTAWLQRKYNNEFLKYTMDSIPADSLKYYLRQHIFPGIISKANMKMWPSKDTLRNVAAPLPVYFLYKENYVTSVSGIQSTTQMIRIRRIYGLPDDQIPAGTANTETDVLTSVQTSEVRTSTNMIHVLFIDANLAFVK